MLGLTEHKAAGSYQCHDSAKPDFNVDPNTGEKDTTCQTTNRVVQIQQGEGCFAARDKAMAVCGGKAAKVIGGARSTSPTVCVKMCSATWGATDETVWVGDNVHYICEGETLDPSGGGNNGGNSGGGSTGQDCKTCSKCIAVTGNGVGATNEFCAPCANGQQAWWPCNTPGACTCG